MNLQLIKYTATAFLTSMCLRIAGLETIGTALMVLSTPVLGYALLQPIINDALGVIREGMREYAEWKRNRNEL